MNGPPPCPQHRQHCGGQEEQRDSPIPHLDRPSARRVTRPLRTAGDRPAEPAHPALSLPWSNPSNPRGSRVGAGYILNVDRQAIRGVVVSRESASAARNAIGSGALSVRRPSAGQVRGSSSPDRATNAGPADANKRSRRVPACGRLTSWVSCLSDRASNPRVGAQRRAVVHPRQRASLRPPRRAK